VGRSKWVKRHLVGHAAIASHRQCAGFARRDRSRPVCAMRPQSQVCVDYLQHDPLVVKIVHALAGAAMAGGEACGRRKDGS
jgi:hypothetical protein